MIEAFSWDARFETHIDNVDAQHRRLVALLNTLIDVLTDRERVDTGEVTALLDALERYAKEHFADEERLMHDGGCDPRHVSAHTRQHQAFVEQIGLARREYLASGAQHDTLELLAGFITSWLTFHILGSDKDMAGQLARVRAGQPAERRQRLEDEHGEGASRILLEAMGRLYDLMARRNIALASAKEELATLNAHLEERVAQRTAELARALAEVERTREQLLQSEKMSAIGQLAAGVAHEINNPVGFVSANLGSLRRYVGQLLTLVDGLEAHCAALDPPPAVCTAIDGLKRSLDFDYLREDVGELLKESAQGLERVKKIVQDMKTFSHVGHAAWVDADLNAVIETALSMVWHELKYKAGLVREFGTLPPIRCVPAQLGQVFMNLLVNASQAIERVPGRIRLATGQDGDWVVATVEDDGKGIAPETLRRIFEPFFTTKPVGQGTGLGLSIAYEIVRRHGGQIEVASTPGQGTRFTVRLPRQPPDEAGSQPG